MAVWLAGDNRDQWIPIVALTTLSLLGLLLAGRSMVARTGAHTEKAQADDRLRMTVQHAPIGMTMVDLDGKFNEPNQRLCSMLAYSAEELSSMTFEEVTHPDDIELDKALVDRLLAREVDHYELEKRFVRSDETVIWGRLTVSLVCAGDSSKPLYFVSQIQDVTEFRAARAELEYRALYDPLTGMANRGLLLDRLTSALADTSRPATIGVGFCDIDHFKKINDVHGHEAGDEVLKEVARRLRSAVRSADDVRSADTVARMGGDEFIILLGEISSQAEAELVIERAARAVRQPMVVNHTTFMVTLSLGLALGEAGQQPDTLLSDADVALYAAKKAGRGRWVVYDPALRMTDGAASAGGERETYEMMGASATTQGSFRMDDMIRHALDHDAIGVAYQPVFDLTTGDLVGAEALLRLQDPEGRTVPPNYVIPSAEASGLITDLGRHVLKVVVRQTAAWHQQHGVLLPVAINVSAAELGLDDFSRRVLDTVKDAGVPPSALILELTESVLLQSGSAGMDQLCVLQHAGIDLAIDDFGTGYASLALLHELPAATLKIDRSFVAGIPHDQRAVTIVDGVIALAKHFDMSYVAEGIENESQLTYLAERGALGQGFLLGIPDDASAIGRLLEGTAPKTEPVPGAPAARERFPPEDHHSEEPDPPDALPREVTSADRPAPGSSSKPVHLAGVYHREAGLTELTREMSRARRTKEPLVVAVATLFDTETFEERSGTAAVHRLLRDIAAALKVGVRPYDLVIAYSDSQFVAAIAGLSLVEWERRLPSVEADIGERYPHASVRIGLAQMHAEDSGDSLIAKALSASQALSVSSQTAS